MPSEPFTPLDLPAFGLPVRCSADCDGSCGCGGGCGCGGADCGGGPTVVSQPDDDCTESVWTRCPPGSRPVYQAGGGGDAIDQALALVERVRRQVLAPLRDVEQVGSSGGVCSAACMRLMPLNSPLALRLQMRPPAAGPGDPRPLFTYNSDTTTGNEFANGWSNAYKRSVTEVDASTATVNTGTGLALSYTCPTSHNVCHFSSLNT